MKFLRPVIDLLLALALLAACTPAPTPLPTATPAPAPSSTPTSPLATPIADQPAAGICATFDGALVLITLYPDIPDPRCAEVRADQQLRVVNTTDGPLDLALGSYTATLDPGAETTFAAPFGTYLAPGVHRLDVQPCCSPELWLKAGSP